MAAENGRPPVAEIDLSALRANYRALRQIGNGARMMAVVKDDAYGHGAIAVAHALREEGCVHFGVATVEEARELRGAGLRKRLYILGGFFAEQAPEIVALRLTPSLFDIALIDAIDRAARNAGKRDFAVHLKIDPGATPL